MKKYLVILFLVLAVLPAFCATRFYLPSSGAAEIAPAYGAGWNDTAAADRIRCGKFKKNTLTGNKTAATPLGTNIYVLNRQFISDPIAAQSFAGTTVYGQLKGAYVTRTTNPAVRIYLVNNIGSVIRTPDIYAIANNANTYPQTNALNRYTPASTAIGAVTAESGDRIVIEIGGYKTVNATGSYFQIFGDDNASDLPIEEATNEVSNPWIEFSRDIIFPSVTVID